MPVVEQMNDFEKIFSDTHLTQINRGIKIQKMSLNNISFHYHKGEMLVNSEGHTFTNQDTEYFETIEGNLKYADLSWLSPICSLFFGAIIDATIQVKPSGHFEHDKVRIVVNQIIPNELSAEQYMYYRLKNFIKFRQYLKEVEFKGFDHNIRHMIFTYDMDGKMVQSILEKAEHNKQVMDQWLATIAQVNLYNKGNFRFCDKVPVTNGKLNYTANRSVVSFKFGNKSKG